MALLAAFGDVSLVGSAVLACVPVFSDGVVVEVAVFFRLRVDRGML